MISHQTFLSIGYHYFGIWKYIKNGIRLRSYLLICLVIILRTFLPHSVYAAIVPTQTIDGYAADTVHGTASVSRDGAATYNIPIWLPRGRSGISPTLSINYHSRGGNGLLGLGWSLQGFSVIGRCPKTIAQDGVASSVRFQEGDAGDRFCLNGQRLVAYSDNNGQRGAYGGQLTEYRTELDIQAKITSLDPDALGPKRFRMFLKDGRILTFGLRLEGQRASVSGDGKVQYNETVSYAWLLTEVEERAGNLMTFEYYVTNSDFGYSYRPHVIKYTFSKSNPSVQPTRSVSFLYEDRPDIIEQYKSGLHFVERNRLVGIEIGSSFPNQKTIREYRFRYRDPGNVYEESKLSQILECDNASICKPPLQFEWKVSSDGYREIPTNIVLPAFGEYSVLKAGPLTTSGVDGLLYRDGAGTWYRYQNFFPQEATPFVGPYLETGLNEPGAPLKNSDGILMDLNGDGRADFLQPREGRKADLTPMYNNHVSYGTHYNVFSPPQQDNPSSGTDRPLQEYVGDVNGDGLPDVIRPQFKDPDHDLSGVWAYTLGGSTSVGVSSREARLPFPGEEYADGLLADIDGSGRSIFGDGRSGFAVENGSSVNYSYATSFPSDAEICATPIFADVNGDSLFDRVDRTNKKQLLISINSGNGFLPPSAWTIPSDLIGSSALSCSRWPTFTEPPTDRGLRIIDFNSDGRHDLLLLSGTHPGGNLVVLLSHSNGFEPVYLPIANGQVVGQDDWRMSQVMDWNGDGLPDIVQYNNNLRLFIHTGTRSTIFRFGSESGTTDSFTYTNSTNPDVQASWSLTECNPEAYCFSRGITVVSRRIFDFGGTSPRTWNYRYGGPVGSLDGRGWLGFEVMEEEESERKLVTRYTYPVRYRIKSFYPCIDYPESIVTTVTLEVSHKTTVTQECNVSASDRGATYFAYVGKRYTYVEEDGIYLRTVRESVEMDQYANPITVHRFFTQHPAYVTPAGYHSEDETYQYVINEVTWDISNVSNASSTSSIYGGESLNRVFTYQYDAETFRRIKEIGPFITKTYTRDLYGNVAKITEEGNGENRTTVYGYDDFNHQYPTLQTNSLGHAIASEYDSSTGLLIQVTDENHQVTSYDYDGFGRIRETDKPGGRDVNFTYGKDTTGHIVVQQREQGIGTSSRTYDGLGQLLQVDDLLMGRSLRKQFHYDSRGFVDSEIWSTNLGKGILSRAYSHDNLGRLTSLRNGDGPVVSYSYKGSTTMLGEAPGVSNVLAEDGLGRLIESTAFDNGATEIKTAYKYGPSGSVSSVNAPMNYILSLKYDLLGNPIYVSNSDTAGKEVKYSAFGLPEEITYENGGGITYQYDQIGRLVSRTETDATHRIVRSVTFVWDEAEHGVGHIASARTSDSVMSTYKYDSYGRVQSETLSVQGISFETLFTYNSNGQVNTVTYPTIGNEPLSIKYFYDDNGGVQRIVNAISGQEYWALVSRSASGAVEEESFGNGLRTARTYSSEGLPVSIKTTGQNKVLQDLAYSYSNIANVFYPQISSLVNSVDGIHGIREEYGYDSMDRLIKWKVTQDGADYVTSYHYDDSGNMVSRIHPPQYGINYTYEYSNIFTHQVTTVNAGSNSYHYRNDVRGNQIERAGQTVTYNYLGLPTDITCMPGPNAICDEKDPIAFKYHPDGSRVLRESTTRSVYYISDIYERRIYDGKIVEVFFVKAPDRTIAQIIRSNGEKDRTLYFHDDRLGSIDTVTDDLGDVTNIFKYDPYGSRRIGDKIAIPAIISEGEVTRGFTSKEHDPNALINMRGRIYDPFLASFLSPDPYVGIPEIGQSFNRYAYAYGNPLSFVDPSGYQSESEDQSSHPQYNTSVGLVCLGSGCGGELGNEETGTPSRSLSQPPANAKEVNDASGEHTTDSCSPSDVANREPIGSNSSNSGFNTSMSKKSSDTLFTARESKNNFVDSTAVLPSASRGLSAGYYASGTAEAGNLFLGAGITASAGLGVFMSSNRINIGGFASFGTFFGNPAAGLSYPPNNNAFPPGHFVFGYYAGAGAGVFVGDAGDTPALDGRSPQVSLNTPIVSVSYSGALSQSSRMATVTMGPSIPSGSLSMYPTNSVSFSIVSLALPRVVFVPPAGMGPYGLFLLPQ